MTPVADSHRPRRPRHLPFDACSNVAKRVAGINRGCGFSLSSSNALHRASLSPWGLVISIAAICRDSSFTYSSLGILLLSHSLFVLFTMFGMSRIHRSCLMCSNLKNQMLVWFPRPNWKIPSTFEEIQITFPKEFLFFFFFRRVVKGCNCIFKDFRRHLGLGKFEVF